MPTIDDVIEAFDKQLLRNERKAASAMVKAYAESWKRIKAQLVKLDTEYARAAAKGGDVSLNWYYQSVRAMQLQEQIARELNKFAKTAGKTITAEQAKAIRESREFALDLIRLNAPKGLAIDFNKLPVKTIETMVGMTQPESPLTKLLSKNGAKAFQDAQEALVQGIALGQNPRKIAPILRDALGMNLSKALTISRTEVMRAHRETSLAVYRTNDDVVKGWSWSSACDATTCPGCFAMHGTEHPLSEKFESHPDCRCGPRPITYTYEELGARYGMDLSAADKAEPSLDEIFKKYGIKGERAEQIRRRYTNGEDAFKSLSDTAQRNILGPTKYAAWKDGKFDFSKLAVKTYSSEWGEGMKTASLKELISESDLEKYRNANKK